MSCLVKIKHRRLKGKPLIVHEDIADDVYSWLHYADYLDIDVFVTNSIRYTDDELHDTVVEPAKLSNHYVGYGWDCNLIDRDNVWWNSKKLRKPTGTVKKLIDKAKDLGFRWGGDFKKPDTVHFDRPLNLKEPELYEKYFYTIQSKL